MSIRIDGKKIGEEIGEKLFLELQKKNLLGKISLGILCVGDDPASQTFINVKKRFGEKYGFVVNILKLSEPKLQSLEDFTDFKNKIISDLTKLQEENSAVIVQLPLPENLRQFTDEILSNIQAEKDVDNLNSQNINKKFQAPIVLALEKVLSLTHKNLFKENEKKEEDREEIVFGIVGLGQVVGLPIFEYLDSKNYRVMKITRNTFEYIGKCDVIISGVGSPYLIKKENIKDGAVLVDYGCSSLPLASSHSPEGGGKGEMCGDFDWGCYQKSSFYTPVPGCMGPLVVASLFENVLKSV